MSSILETFRNADFTGLNRAFGKGKHSPKIPCSNQSPQIGVGVSPISNRSKSGFAKIGAHPTPNSNSNSILDDQDTALTQVSIRAITVFFLTINLFIYIAIAVFQKKSKVGPSGLTGLAIFILLQALIHALVLLLVPQIYERTDLLRGFARAIRLTRVQFIVYGTQAGLTLIISLVTTISAYTGGCKDHKADPHASDSAYLSHLAGFCRNKRAAAAFWWFTFLSFGLSLAIVFKSWHSTRKFGPSHAAFEPPQGVGGGGLRTAATDDEDGLRAEEPYYESPDRRGGGQQEMSSVRPSNVGGYYGERPVFESDRIPAGYGYSGAGVGPIGTSSEGGYARPTAQQMTTYKDPFDEIRAQIYQGGR